MNPSTPDGHPFTRGLLALLACAAAACSPEPPAPDTAARWWTRVQQLSSDAMQGREAGTAGHAAAADYLAEEFRRLGLEPAGEVGYFQTVPLLENRIDTARSSLTLLRRDGDRVLHSGEHYVLGGNLGSGEIDAEAVFVGHGLVIPELGIDDLAGLDLGGRIAVTLRGAPEAVPSVLRAHYGSRREQWAALAAAGAIGLLVILDPQAMDTPWERIAARAGEANMEVDDTALQDTPGRRVAGVLNPARADALLAGTGYTVASLLSLAEQQTALPRFTFPGRLRVAIVAEQRRTEARNVAAILRGSDAELREEYVVLSAHLDGLGVGQPFDGDAIYNGTMDNAAGVATLLEIAAELAAAPPRRSILFLAVTAEEKGLRGSDYFAHYPTVPTEAIVANLNFDMYLPIIPLERLEVLGLEESTLGGTIRELAAERGVAVTGDIEPRRVLFVRSDQYSFIRRGVPALSFKFGFEPDSPAHEVMRRWLQQRYHAPADDLDQPVEFAAAQAFNDLMSELARRIADGRSRPRWHEDSFFRRFAAVGDTPETTAAGR